MWYANSDAPQSARSIELDHDQCCALVVEMLEELEEDMVNYSIKLTEGHSPYVFSLDAEEDKKQLRKMLKAIKRVKSWYAA
jgi:hypothetical protein